MDKRGARPLTEDDSGQTLQDYLLGVSFMILAVVFVVGYVPSVFDSYESTTGNVLSEQADRAATYLVETYSVADRPNVLKYDESGGIHAALSTSEGIRDLRERASLNTSTDRRMRPYVNVILVNSSQLTNSSKIQPIVESDEQYSYGNNYGGGSAARATRVVQLHGDDTHCTPTCWLVVRVW